MKQFNQELVARLAHGDNEAHKEIESLPSTTKLSLGMAVEDYRIKNNVGPISKSWLYEGDSQSESVSDDGLKDSMQRLIDERKQKEEEKERFSQDAIKNHIEKMTARSRSGLPIK